MIVLYVLLRWKAAQACMLTWNYSESLHSCEKVTSGGLISLLVVLL